jgi:hypothetical protein
MKKSKNLDDVSDSIFNRLDDGCDDVAYGWWDMPEYSHDFEYCHSELEIIFEDEDALNELCDLTGLRLTTKSKSVWYPKFPYDDMEYRWASNNDEE